MKNINDNYGYNIGDRYIKRAAEVVKDSVRTKILLPELAEMNVQLS